MTDAAGPSNIPAEQVVLGSLLVSTEGWRKAASVLTEQSFADERHAKIWLAIKAEIERHDAARPIALFHRLASELLPLGPEYLLQLASLAQPISDIHVYVAAVHECWVRRQLIQLAKTIAETGQNTADPALLAKMASLQREFVRITRLAAVGDYQHDSAGDVAASFVRDSNDPEQEHLYSTGYAALDDAMDGGLRRGRLYGFGARTKGFKTTVMLSLAVELTLRGIRCGWIAVELGRKKVGQRYWAAVAQVTPAAIERRDIAAIEAIDRYRAQRGDPPFWIRDAGDCDWQQIKLMIEELIEERRIKVIFIDYWQIIPGEDRRGKAVHLAEIAKEMAKLAVERQIAVVVAAQIRDDGRTYWGEVLEQSSDWFGIIHRHSINLILPTIGSSPLPQLWITTKIHRDAERVDAGSEEHPVFTIDPRGPRLVPLPM